MMRKVFTPSGGATIQNILDFEKDFKPYGIQIFKLEQNHRSTQPHCTRLRQRGDHTTANRYRRPSGRIRRGHRIKVIKALTDGEEGKRVLTPSWNRRTASTSATARSPSSTGPTPSRGFEEYLRRYNVAYRVFGGLSFYQRKEVKDLIAYLRLAVNPNDEEALRRIINYPKRGIGNSTVDKVGALTSQVDKPLWQCLGSAQLSNRAQNAINDFVTMAKSFIRRADSDNAYELFRPYRQTFRHPG